MPSSPPPLPRAACAAAAAIALLASLAAAPASGQPVLRDDEELAFDRPEAWAMKWFAAVTLPNGLGGPDDLAAGEVELGFDAGWVPSLSEEERRVGFRGTKVEDINRTDFVGRPTVKVGLPAGWGGPGHGDGKRCGPIVVGSHGTCWEARAPPSWSFASQRGKWGATSA